MKGMGLGREGHVALYGMGKAQTAGNIPKPCMSASHSRDKGVVKSVSADNVSVSLQQTKEKTERKETEKILIFSPSINENET